MVKYLLMKAANAVENAQVKAILDVISKDGRPVEIDDENELSILLEDFGAKGVSVDTTITVLEEMGFDTEIEENIEGATIEWKGDI